MIKFIFFGSSEFSRYVLQELAAADLTPILNITSARDPIDMEKLRELDADVFIVASFGKILPDELINIPKFKTLNVHPSLLPKLRGAAPIQSAILSGEDTGVSIMRMDKEVDHGPLLATEEVPMTPWPYHYAIVEEKLGHAGGKLLAEVLPHWIAGDIKEAPQDHSLATYTKMIEKEDGLLNLSDSPEVNLHKVLAYSTWPGAFIYFRKKNGEDTRVVIRNAKIEDSKFIPTRVIPAGKKEMVWEDFLRGNA